MIERPPLRLLYVRPLYGGYRYAARKVFPATAWQIDYDHALGRKMANQLGFNYVLLIRIPPNANRSHGRFEHAEPIVGLCLNKLCFADRRIIDKWLGRPSGHMRDRSRLRPYRVGEESAYPLSLKQAGRWGFAMGMEDDPQPPVELTPLWRPKPT